MLNAKYALATIFPKLIITLSLILAVLIPAKPSYARPSPPPITAQNAANLTEIGTLGRGAINQVLWSHTGDSMIGITQDAIWQYHFGSSLSLAESKTIFNQSFQGELTFDRAFQQFAVIDRNRQRLEIYATQSIQKIGEIKHDFSQAWWVLFIPNSTRLLTATLRGFIEILDYASGQVVQTFQTRIENNAMDISPDGTHFVFTGKQPDQIGLGYIPDGTLETTYFIDNLTGSLITTVAFSPDGKYIGVSANSKLQVIDLQTHEVTDIGTTSDVSEVSQMLFSPDGKYIAVRSYSEIKIWDFPERKLINRLTGYQRMRSFAFHPTQPFLAISDDFGLQIVNIRNKGILARNFEHLAEPLDVAFSPDNQTLGAVYADGYVRLWNTTTRSHQGIWLLGARPTWGSHLEFGSKGGLLAVSTGAYQNAAFLLNPKTRKFIHTYAPRSSYDIGLMPSNNQIILTEWGTVYILDVHSNQLVYQSVLGMGSATFAVSGDGKYLATGSDSGTSNPIILINTMTWKEVAGFGFFTVYSASALVFHPDNLHLASTNGGNIAIWDIRPENLPHLDGNSKPSITIPTPSDSGQGNSFGRIAYSKDGVLLLAECGGQTFLYDTADYKVVKQILGGTFALSPDGTKLATINNGIIRLWGIQP